MDTLDEIEVEEKVDRPGVGENFRDHPLLPLFFHAKRDLSNIVNDHVVVFGNWEKASEMPNELIVTLPFSPLLTLSRRKAPDYQITLYSNAKELEYHSDISVPSDCENCVAITVTLLHPKSKGKLHIQSKEEDPFLECNFLSKKQGEKKKKIGACWNLIPLDLENLLKTIEVVQEIVKKPVLKEFMKGAYKEELGEEYVRNNVVSAYHSIGTAKVKHIFFYLLIIFHLDGKRNRHDISSR